MKIIKVTQLVKEDDKSVEIKECKVSTKTGDLAIVTRVFGEFKGKALVLSNEYNWEIKRDSGNFLCLIPTKK